MKHLFWSDIVVCVNFVIVKSLIFADVYVLLNQIPVVWGLANNKGVFYESLWLLRDLYFEPGRINTIY